jgi:hypothetical protein
MLVSTRGPVLFLKPGAAVHRGFGLPKNGDFIGDFIFVFAKLLIREGWMRFEETRGTEFDG